MGERMLLGSIPAAFQSLVDARQLWIFNDLNGVPAWRTAGTTQQDILKENGNSNGFVVKRLGKHR